MTLMALVEMYLVYTNQKSYIQDIEEQSMLYLLEKGLMETDTTKKIQLSNTGQALLLSFLKEESDSDLKYTPAFEKF